MQQFYLQLRTTTEAGRIDMEALKALVQRAKAADSAYPSTFGIEARSMYETSRSAKSKRERVGQLGESLKTYNQAIELQENLAASAGRSPAMMGDLRLLLTGRSQVHLELAFFADAQMKLRTEHLEAALHDAALALGTDDEAVAEPHEAYLKLANALEDHAYYLKDAAPPTTVHPIGARERNHWPSSWPTAGW